MLPAWLVWTGRLMRESRIEPSGWGVVEAIVRRSAVHGGRVYDVIVVGACCAGAATAMLLARRGLDVLLVDRASFPERAPTWALHPPPAHLHRWGLLDRVLATGCSPITSFVVFGERLGLSTF